MLVAGLMVGDLNARLRSSGLQLSQLEQRCKELLHENVQLRTSTEAAAREHAKTRELNFQLVREIQRIRRDAMRPISAEAEVQTEAAGAAEEMINPNDAVPAPPLCTEVATAHNMYSSSLLLAHREISLKIECGPPGLPPPPHKPSVRLPKVSAFC